MEAKDTVMDLHGLTVGEVGVANQQAEVSFKAGRDSFLDDVGNATIPLSEAHKAGIRKVVEWVELQHIEYTCECGTNFIISNKKWQAQKKKRGINGD